MRVAHGVADAGVGDACDVVGGDIILFGEEAAAALADGLDGYAFVARGGVAGVDPEEGADLVIGTRGFEDLHAFGGYEDDLAWGDVLFDFEAEVGEGAGLAGDGPGAGAGADDERKAAVGVAGGDDALVGEEEHGDGALDLLVHLGDAVDDVSAGGDDFGD